MSIIQILIPTYNRAEDLVKNLAILKTQLSDDNLQAVCGILISDNCSSDKTEALVLDFKQANREIKIDYYRNQTNIGLEANVVNTFSKATADYILCLGDDDFLADGYLRFCYDSVLQNAELGCIVPGLSSIKADGSVIAGRREAFDIKKLEKGYGTVFEFSHFGHQMSGLLFRRKGLLEAYLSKEAFRNPYLFVFFTSYCMLHYDTIYAPVYKTRVNSFNEKAWSYNGIGLLDEVYKSYYALENELSASAIADLMIRFTVMHSYRLSFKVGKTSLALRQYMQLVDKSNRINGFRRKLAFVFIKEYTKTLLNEISR